MTIPFLAARTAADLSQSDLSDRARVSQRFVSDLDRGRVPRSLVLAARVARALGVTLDDLFPGAADVRLRRDTEGPQRRKRKVADGPVVVREGFDQREGA